MLRPNQQSAAQPLLKGVGPLIADSGLKLARVGLQESKHSNPGVHKGRPHIETGPIPMRATHYPLLATSSC